MWAQINFVPTSFAIIFHRPKFFDFSKFQVLFSAIMTNINLPTQLFSLIRGDQVSKRNLFDVIRFSKVEGSQLWSGTDYIIGNTPQQGINWIGELPYLKGVVIKASHGVYKDDGWVNREKTLFRYSFKSRKGKINLSETANIVLINQPKYLYPILLFIEKGNQWQYQGFFYVRDIHEKYVVLGMESEESIPIELSQDEIMFKEGGRRYANHLVIERNKKVVAVVKGSKEWKCDICDQNYFARYGVEYIEAHHIIPLSSYESEVSIKVSDFVLLCPNCHKAVHIYLKVAEKEYADIKQEIRDHLNSK